MFWKKRIYVDAAAATPLSPSARKELLRLLPIYGNAGALHSEALHAKEELEKARASIAKSIGAHADEIFFTASGTEGNNLALQGVLRPLLQKHGELHAITSAVEHQSVLEPLRSLKPEGLLLTEVSVLSDGLVFPSAVSEAANERTAMISVQLLNSEMGAVEPLREIVKEARRIRAARGKDGIPLYVHTDASQAPLWVPIHVEKLGVDLLTLDGQKVQAPKGVGALYVRRGTPIKPLLWGGKQEKGLRGGTENLPQIGAFAVGLADAVSGLEARVRRVSKVRDYLFSEIQKLLPDVHLHGPELAGGKRAANNINISVPKLDAEMAVIALDTEGVAASTRSACNTGDQDPSHVIKALGVPHELAKTAIRLTLLPDVSYADARAIARALATVAARYKKT